MRVYFLLFTNPIDYLYYKIYVALSYISGGGDPVNNGAAFGFLLTLNVLTAYTLVLGDSLNLFFLGGWIVFIVFVIIYYKIRKEDKILNKYKRESEKSRIIGNAIVFFYVLFTIISFVLVEVVCIPKSVE